MNIFDNLKDCDNSIDMSRFNCNHCHNPQRCECESKCKCEPKCTIDWEYEWKPVYTLDWKCEKKPVYKIEYECKKEEVCRCEKRYDCGCGKEKCGMHDNRTIDCEFLNKGTCKCQKQPRSCNNCCYHK